MKVFSKEKYIKDMGEETYSLAKVWVDQCEGLTEEEMLEQGYATEKAWMIDKEDYLKVKDNKASIDLKVNVDDEGLEDTIDILKEATELLPNITIRNNEQVYVTINNFNTTAKEYYKQ